MTHRDPRDEIFASVADRTFAAALIAEGAGIVTPLDAAVGAAEEIGLQVDFRLPEAATVRPGDHIARFRGTPKQIAIAEERLIGTLAKPSGIATAAAHFVERAAGRLQIVSGAWKKLPLSQKEMIRSAVVAGGADFRITTPPFVYLDKNFVAMLGGPRRTLAAVAHMDDHRSVIQIDDPTQAGLAASAGADIVFVDSGRRDDVASAAADLRRLGLRGSVELAFGGGVQLEDIDELKRLDVDIVDVGRAIVDAPLLDMRLCVGTGPLREATACT
jgi:nicotinate-nucleotide pyrophosphorylase (carboxylating)